MSQHRDCMEPEYQLKISLVWVHSSYMRGFKFCKNFIKAQQYRPTPRQEYALGSA
jgi:hypothetical protein